MSTPRLRITKWLYGGVVLLAAVTEPVCFAAPMQRLVSTLGLGLMIIATLGRIWSSSFIAGAKDRLIVTVGPYSQCRHPLYFCSWIGSLGLGLATASLLIAATLAGVVYALLAQAMRMEEIRLLQLNGAVYRSYCATTPRFWPRLRSTPLPQQTEWFPPIYAKAFWDAASFLGLYVCIAVAQILRQAGAWPTWLRLA